MVAHLLLHRLAAHERLHRPGQTEPKDEGPEGLPEHEEALTQAASDVREHGHTGDKDSGHDRTSRAMAADASASFCSASSPPAWTALVTQCARCSSSRSKATDWRAAVAADTWASTSMQ